MGIISPCFFLRKSSCSPVSTPDLHDRAGCNRGSGFADDVVVAVNDDGDDVEGTNEWD